MWWCKMVVMLLLAVLFQSSRVYAQGAVLKACVELHDALRMTAGAHDCGGIFVAGAFLFTPTSFVDAAAAGVQEDFVRCCRRQAMAC
jgi:hypothetical protein